MAEPSAQMSSPRQAGDFSLDVKAIASPTLRRLIDEVRQERSGSPAAYNRFHNRHNRGR